MIGLKRRFFFAMAALFICNQSSYAADWLSYKNTHPVTKETTLIIINTVGSWSAWYSESDAETLFCFLGPFLVEPTKTYSVRFKFGNGNWFEEDLTANLEDTLCIDSDKTARGMLGAIGQQGNVAFGLFVGGEFEWVDFPAANLGSIYRKFLGWD